MAKIKIAQSPLNDVFPQEIIWPKECNDAGGTSRLSDQYPTNSASPVLFFFFVTYFRYSKTKMGWLFRNDTIRSMDPEQKVNVIVFLIP